jgi:hypothetical protein
MSTNLEEFLVDPGRDYLFSLSNKNALAKGLKQNI